MLDRLAAWWLARNNQAPSQEATNPRFNPWAGIDAFYGDLTVVNPVVAMQYAPFARAIHLISNKMAKIIVNTAYIQDREKSIVRTPRAKQALRLLCHAPDGSGMISAQQFVRMLAQDYLVGGNSLVYIPKGIAAGTGSTYRPPIKMLRLNAPTANTMVEDASQGYDDIRYKASVYGMGSQRDEFPAVEVAHSRYFEPFSDGVSGLAAASMFRSWFGLSPLYMLANALKIGGNSDEWVIDFYNHASKSNLHVGFPDDADPDVQKDAIESVLASITDKRIPVVTHGGAVVKELRPTPESADSRGMREYQVMEIARFYGISPPSIGINVTQWGSGIDNLTRLDYRRCFEIHIDALLDSLAMRLLPEGQCFAVSALEETRGDMKAITEFANAMKPSPNGPALASRAEIRQHAGLVGDMDDDYGELPWQGSESEGGEDASEDEGGESEESRRPTMTDLLTT